MSPFLYLSLLLTDLFTALAQILVTPCIPKLLLFFLSVCPALTAVVVSTLKQFSSSPGVLLSGFQHCTVLACSPLLYLPEAGRGIDVSKKPLRLPYEFLVSQGGLSLSHLYQYVLQLQFQGRRCPCSYCSVTCSRKNIFLEESIVPVLARHSQLLSELIWFTSQPEDKCCTRQSVLCSSHFFLCCPFRAWT